MQSQSRAANREAAAFPASCPRCSLVPDTGKLPELRAAAGNKLADLFTTYVRVEASKNCCNFSRVITYYRIMVLVVAYVIFSDKVANLF